MKCPYRIITKWTPLNEKEEPCETKEFAECYGAECPLYIPNQRIASVVFPSACKRANQEAKKAGN